MNPTRRHLFAAMGASAFAGRGRSANLPIAEGKFKPNDESLKQYQYPDWFRDAKFGMWARWGPQAVPRLGNWYAKRMYLHDIPGRGGGATRSRPCKQVSPRALRPPLQIRLQGHHSALESGTVES